MSGDLWLTDLPHEDRRVKLVASPGPGPAPADTRSTFRPSLTYFAGLRDRSSMGVKESRKHTPN